MSHAALFQVDSPQRLFEKPSELTGWSQLSFDFVQTLALRVRILAVSQVEQVWFPTADREEVENALQSLTSAQLVSRCFINAHPLLELREPLASWSPIDQPPDSQVTSIAARRRWTEFPQPIEVLVATKKAANLFGGGSHGLPPIDHRDHDLLLAAVYVHYRLQCREYATDWIGEDYLPKAGYRIKDPDAFLVDKDGVPYRVVESAGRYSRKQIESFHDYCESAQISYELW